MSAALLVFAKVPRPDHVKTRLTPHLSPSDAARLYTAFLRDTIRQARQLEADVQLYLAPPVPDDGLDALPSDVRLREQSGEGLGERMSRAFRETLRDGYDRGVLVGSDHPTLPRSFLRRAFQALQEPDTLCIGPTDDGGFYGLGMNAFYPGLFENMSYSHGEVFSGTLARAAHTEASVTVLPRWYDVDRPEDIDQLLYDLNRDAARAPNTRRIVTQLGLRGSDGSSTGST